MNSTPTLRLKGSIHYGEKPVLQDVALTIAAGEVLGIVGHSGCGKSSLALAGMGLLDFKGGGFQGALEFKGRDLAAASEREWRKLRGKEISLVLQSPQAALNPALALKRQMEEAWRVHAHTSSAECEAGIRAALESVALPSDRDFLRRKPAQISVGQAQRVVIAMAVLHRPSLVIADEPTSALDVITQAEVLALFNRLNASLGMSMMFISHDLLSVANLCHRVVIIHEGRIVEEARTELIFSAPQHPFTQQLVKAIPSIPCAHDGHMMTSAH
jgi:ABC-type dipeptide/oligopeptide/nickel transport system ATPase component